MKDNNRKNDIEKTTEPGPAVETAKEAPGPEAREAPKEAPKPGKFRLADGGGEQAAPVEQEGV